LARDRAVLELGYAAGLRVSELANLRLEDLNLDALTLTVRRGKGGNDRVGYFGRPAAVALQEYIGDRKSGFVFVQQNARGQQGGVFRDPHGAWWGQWRETDASGRRSMRSVRLGDHEIRNKDEARDAFAALMEFRLARVKTTDQPSRPLSTRTIWRMSRTPPNARA
jgi:integrase